MSSCQKKKIDGVWIGQYNLHELNGEKSYHKLNTIIKINNNKFYNKTLGIKSKESSFEFTQNGNKIVPHSNLHIGFNIKSSSKDSLVLSFPQMDSFSLVYRKYIERPEITNLNLAGNNYKDQNSGEIYKLSLDSTLIKNSKPSGKWNLQSIYSIKVLTFSIGDSLNVMVLDSLKNKKIFLTEYSRSIRKIVLEEN